MNVVRWAGRSVKERGVVQTAKVTWSVICDLGFDLQYGTDTMRWIGMNSLAFEAANKRHSSRYQATKAAPFRSLLRALDFPRESVFVDLGSGKGRALLIAASAGFRRVVGVEFSPELCEIARRNVAVYLRKVGSMADVEIVESDVETYPIAADQNVFFLYNSFKLTVLNRVLNNIRDSVARNQRRIWFIYNTPIYHDAVAQAGVFNQCVDYSILGTDFKVFRS
jgi:SAM-dependent methyltransferase